MVKSSEQSFGSWILPLCSISSSKNSLHVLQDMGKQNNCNDLECPFKNRPKSQSFISFPQFSVAQVGDCSDEDKLLRCCSWDTSNKVSEMIAGELGGFNIITACLQETDI